MRTARQDITLAGTELKRGDRVWLLIAGGNRDPRQFAAPEEIDFGRGPGRHLAFGYGARYCLGVHLARLELRVALEELLARLGEFRIEDTRIKYDSGCSRGPSELNIRSRPVPSPTIPREVDNRLRTLLDPLGR